MRRFTVTLLNGDKVDMDADSIVLSTSYVQITTSPTDEQPSTPGVRQQGAIPVLEFNSRIRKATTSDLSKALNPGRAPGPQYGEENQDKWVCVGAIFEPWVRVTSVEIAQEATTNA